MAIEAIRVLLIEDNTGDARLVREALVEKRRSRPAFELFWVKQLSAGLSCLSSIAVDVILLDLNLPDGQGPDTFGRVTAVAPDIPIVVLSGLDEEEMALTMVQEGAQDYLVKGLNAADILPRVLRYAIERQRAQRQIRRIQAELQQQIAREREARAQLVHAARLAAIGELAAGVAHELNNPLTSVLGFAELLLQTPPSDSLVREYLQIIVKEARRARNIVRNLLDFARQSPPHRVPADINNLLRTTLDLIREHLQKSGLVIEENYADLGLIRVDECQMKQVFLNLLTNAAQAMPQGGTLRLRTAQAADGVVIEVSDTGMGMPPEVQARLFEPFFTTKPHGTGLGLSVSLGIVQSHGGRITVKSEMGAGSTFTVWLPCEPGGRGNDGGPGLDCR